MKYPFFRSFKVPPCVPVAASLLALGLGTAASALAATDSYTGTGTSSWNSTADWSTGVIAGSGDTAVFNSPANTANETVTLDANQSVLGIQSVATEGGVSISSTSAAPNGTYTLTLGTGGITNNGSGTINLNANVVIAGNQTWSGANAVLVNDSLTGTGNIAFTTRVTATNALAGNVTGTATLSGNGDMNANFLNTFSGGITLVATTIGLQGSGTVTDTHTLTFSGGGNYYTNGQNQIYSASVFGVSSGVMNSIGSGNLTFSGATDNTGLSVNTPGGTTYLAKTSSASVHAIGGNLSIAGGSTVQITGTGGDQIIDSGNVTLNTGSTFDLNGNNETINNLTGTAGTVTNSAASTASSLTVGAANGSSTFAGVLQNGVGGGTLGLTKRGTGTLTLTGANTYTGTTTVRNGTLLLDSSATGAPATNIVSSSSALDLAGGTLSIKGAASGATSQTFNGVTVDPGASAAVVASNGGSGTTLALGTITRNAGGTVDFTLPTSGSISTTTVNASFTGGQQTILGGYATVNGGAGWAVSGSGATAGNVSALGSYNGGFAAGTDVDVAGGTSTPGAMTVNSIRFNAASAATVNTAGNLVIATGGLLVTPTVGANATAINNNTITSGNGQDLIVNQFNSNSAGPLTVGSAIVNNGGTSIGLTKSGTGALNLTGANTYTGATNLNGGTTTVSNTSSLGSGSAVNMKGGSTLAFTNIGAQLNLQSIGATATASSNNQPASNAIDGTGGVGNTGTRWETASSDPQYIVIDLKGNYNIGSVNIAWETADAKAFQLQTAPGGTATAPNESGSGGTATNGWTTDYNTTTNPGNGTGVGPSFNGYLTYNLNSGSSGEFLAMYGTTRNTGYGYSIWDVQIFTAAGAYTQTIGSLSGDSTTTVSLPSLLTLNTGSDNTSTTFAGVINGVGNLYKDGTGTMTLSGTNTYTGATTVNGGTLSLAKAGGIAGTTLTAGTLGGATAVTVNGAGTLLVSASNALNAASTVTLNGGAFSVASGVLQGQGATVAGGTGVTGLGALTLTATGSTLNFLGTSGTVVYSSFAPGTFTLNVTGTNFGTATASADGTTDRLIFATDETAYLNDFTFNGVAGATEVTLGASGFYEIIPAGTAVPEPATWAAGLLCVGVFGWGLRRKLRAA